MTHVDPQSARQIASRLASRRSFLRLAGLGVAGVGLAACSSGTTTTTSSSAAAAEGSTAAASGSAVSTAIAPGSNGSISLQLSWIKNIEFGGEYFADSKGYYTQAGFSAVDLVTGPVDSADALVAAGNVTVGISAPDATARFISEQGAPLKVIASTFQKNPFCILSLEQGKPIRTVADLAGKKIGKMPAGPPHRQGRRRHPDRRQRLRHHSDRAVRYRCLDRGQDPGPGRHHRSIPFRRRVRHLHRRRPDRGVLRRCCPP